MAETLRESLTAAAKAGIIATAQVEPLASFVEARAASPASVAADVPNQEEDSEIPRFIRGYHDILITIGIIVVMIGIAGVAGPYAAVAASIVLAEIFVYRQRLALPSFALTVAYTIYAGFVLVDLDFSYLHVNESVLNVTAPRLASLAALECIALGLFYWRYRVPVALAALLVAAVVTVVGLALSGIYPGDYAQFGDALLLTAGVVLIIIAIRFDLMDPKRVLTKSDVGFWLYLVAVPAVLKGVFGGVQPQTSAGALSVVAALVMMMALGLLLDRRAFVTAGLVYLGYAFITLLNQYDGYGQLGMIRNNKVMWILVAIGVIVLSVGFGWRFLRQHLLGALPAGLRARLPVLR